MSDTNNLMNLISASLGTDLDAIYQRLLYCDFSLKDLELTIFVVALLIAMGRDGPGNMCKPGTAERGSIRLMRCRH